MTGTSSTYQPLIYACGTVCISACTILGRPPPPAQHLRLIHLYWRLSKRLWCYQNWQSQYSCCTETCCQMHRLNRPFRRCTRRLSLLLFWKWSASFSWGQCWRPRRWNCRLPSVSSPVRDFWGRWQTCQLRFEYDWVGFGTIESLLAFVLKCLIFLILQNKIRPTYQMF